MNRTRVIFYERRSRPNGNISLETIFQNLRNRLVNDLDSEVRTAPCYSNGFFKRLRIMLDASRPRSELMHVTGDIHFAVILRKPQKTILTIHDCGDLTKRNDLAARLLKLLWFKIPVRRCGYLTVVSDATKRDVIELTGCPAGKIMVIRNSISPAFKPVAQPFNTQTPRILQIGTARNKNVERLAAALNGIQCKLVIVGKLNESQERALRDSAVEYEDMVNLSDSELIDQYVQCDVLSFASEYEGFGMPIVEAQAVGRPVVTSNCSSMPEVAGAGACLVDPFDEQSIREGLLRVITDENYRQTIVDAGFENARRFDPDEVAGQYLSLYQTAVGQLC